jgi:hypothetical protein
MFFEEEEVELLEQLQHMETLLNKISEKLKSKVIKDLNQKVSLVPVYSKSNEKYSPTGLYQVVKDGESIGYLTHTDLVNCVS